MSKNFSMDNTSEKTCYWLKYTPKQVFLQDKRKTMRCYLCIWTWAGKGKKWFLTADAHGKNSIQFTKSKNSIQSSVNWLPNTAHILYFFNCLLNAVLYFYEIWIRNLFLCSMNNRKKEACRDCWEGYRQGRYSSLAGNNNHCLSDMSGLSYFPAHTWCSCN